MGISLRSIFLCLFLLRYGIGFGRKSVLQITSILHMPPRDANCSRFQSHHLDGPVLEISYQKRGPLTTHGTLEFSFLAKTGDDSASKSIINAALAQSKTHIEGSFAEAFELSYRKLPHLAAKGFRVRRRLYHFKQLSASYSSIAMEMREYLM